MVTRFRCYLPCFENRKILIWDWYVCIVPWNQNFPQFCGQSIDVLLKLQTINYIKIRSVDTVLPKSRVENDKDKQLHDMVQKFSSGEISREQFLFSLKWVSKFSLKWVTICRSYVRLISLLCPVNSLKCLSSLTTNPPI